MTIGAVPGPRRHVTCISPSGQQPDRAQVRPRISPTSGLRSGGSRQQIDAIETAYESCRKHVVSTILSASFSAVLVAVRRGSHVRVEL